MSPAASGMRRDLHIPATRAKGPNRAAALIAAALLALGAQAVPAQGANAGRDLAAACANCHGTNGNARGGMRPLAGMPADKMVAMLADFRSGSQPATIMHQIAKGYTEEQSRLIAAYFAAQQAAAK